MRTAGAQCKTRAPIVGTHRSDQCELASAIRQGIACVKHQNMSGSDIGDDHKEYFSGEAALKAAGKDNTMNQF
jgi:isocitrate lyase